MKAKFVRTKNVKKFITLINNLTNRAKGVPGMALVFGEPGLGKTQAALWWAAKNRDEILYIRAKQSMTPRWLLEEIVKEQDEQPLDNWDNFILAKKTNIRFLLYYRYKNTKLKT